MSDVDHKRLDHKCLVVNLFGEPCTGKSTGAAYVFSCLKMLGIRVELVTEYAKDMVWDECALAFSPDAQAYLFGNQLWRMLRCADKVDVIVTDSPLLLNIPYNKSDVLGESFNRTVSSVFKSFDNISYMVTGTKRYDQTGRIQSKDESAEIRQKIIDCLQTESVDYTDIEGELSGYHLVVSDVMEVLRERK